LTDKVTIDAIVDGERLYAEMSIAEILGN